MDDTKIIIAVLNRLLCEIESLHPNKTSICPKAALLFWFFGDFRCGVPLFIVILVMYKYKNR